MRRLCAFLAVSGLFVAINLVAAAVWLYGGQITFLVIPAYSDSMWAAVLVGLAGIAAAIVLAKWGLAGVMRLLGLRRTG